MYLEVYIKFDNGHAWKIFCSTPKGPRPILSMKYEYIPFASRESQFIMFFALFHSCKINMKILDHLMVYKNID